MKPLMICLLCLAGALFGALPGTLSAQQRTGSSVLEIIDVGDGSRRVVREFDYIIEAPNWTPDGKWLVYNSGGRLYKISPDQPGDPVQIETGFADRCNNDHVISADGRQIAISHVSDGGSRVYTLPFGGGTPALVTPAAPSYTHGWSPDMRRIAYCAARAGNYDVYTIPAGGGQERRLTTAEGLDDGPEYSPDGKYIWFNSVRSGLMQVWRMRPDGSQQTQMTFHDDRNSWFPHVSPDGRQVVYIAYRKGDVDPGAHPADKNVELWLMSAAGPAKVGAMGAGGIKGDATGAGGAKVVGGEPAAWGEPRLLVQFFGGQGSLNVNSWAPDSRRLAFVSYRR